MSDDMHLNQIGRWAFILGVAISVVAGLASSAINAAAAGMVMLVLVLLGLIVGYLNIGHRQVEEFLYAAIAVELVGTANLFTIPVVGMALTVMVWYVAAFVAPAALVVALRSVYGLASRPVEKPKK